MACQQGNAPARRVPSTHPPCLAAPLSGHRPPSSMRRGKADLRQLLEEHTYSRGPPLASTRRSALESAAHGLSAVAAGLSADARVGSLATAGALEADAVQAEAALQAATPARFQGLSQFGRGTLSGAAAVLLVGCVAWLALRQRSSRVEGLMAGAVHASHPTPAVHHAPLPSIIPGVRERFELTEVVEQTGAPVDACAPPAVLVPAVGWAGTPRASALPAPLSCVRPPLPFPGRRQPLQRAAPRAHRVPSRCAAAHRQPHQAQ